MCVHCAYTCKGESLYDLCLSSNSCKDKNHKLSLRTTILKGYGKFTAAIEYINATIQIQVKSYLEA